MNQKMIHDHLNRIFEQLKGSKTELIAVTKTRTVEEINCAIDYGVRHIGENRVQELMEKYDALHKDHLKIHLIGRLQTNKVKYIIGKVDLIHSVDSLKLAEEISKRALAKNLCQEILVEVNVGEEESKGGVSKNELIPLLHSLSQLPGIKVRGLMCIPPVALTEHGNLKYFLEMKKLLVDISNEKIDNIDMDILSMGMSDDYPDAIAAGSSFIRVGTAIFGERNYTEVKENGKLG